MHRRRETDNPELDHLREQNGVVVRDQLILDFCPLLLETLHGRRCREPSSETFPPGSDASQVYSNKKKARAPPGSVAGRYMAPVTRPLGPRKDRRLDSLSSRWCVARHVPQTMPQTARHHRGVRDDLCKICCPLQRRAYPSVSELCRTSRQVCRWFFKK